VGNQDRCRVSQGATPSGSAVVPLTTVRVDRVERPIFYII
jgi:hypothetical protein